MARFWEIDFFRGIAVIMMVIFHCLFYIDYFGFANLSLYSGFIGRFQMIIPLIFLAVSGISSNISIKFLGKKAVLLRGLKIFAYGMIISLATWMLFPKEFVFFGILHCIGACIIISCLVNEKMALIIGMTILFISNAVNNYAVNYKYLSILGFKYEGLSTFDYYPLVPWIGIFLIGFYIGGRFYMNKRAKRANNKAVDIVCLIGRHSLLIYFIHIIALFSFFWLLKNFFLA
jgi:uncharacterized membrane protein